jgi:hypothetical protein
MQRCASSESSTSDGCALLKQFKVDRFALQSRFQIDRRGRLDNKGERD